METTTSLDRPRAPKNSDAELGLDFERVCTGPDKHRLRDVFRARVPGGWLVVSGPARGGLCFVPDLQHSWQPTGGGALPLVPPSSGARGADHGD